VTVAPPPSATWSEVGARRLSECGLETRTYAARGGWFVLWRVDFNEGSAVCGA